MKIAKVEQFYPGPRARLVKITTDNGLVGWGESTLEGKARSRMAAVDEIGDYLIGKDPLRIEHHWQHVYRSAFFRGGAILMSRALRRRPGAVGHRRQALRRARLPAARRRHPRPDQGLRALGHPGPRATRGWRRSKSASTCS